MSITFSENEINEIIYKIFEIKRIASILEKSNNFSVENFNATLVGIVKNLAIIFLSINYSQNSTVNELTKEQILIEITNSYNILKVYENEIIL